MSRAALIGASALALLALGCEEPVQVGPAPAAETPARTRRNRRQPPAKAPAATDDAGAPVAALTYTDDFFAEADVHRDPFRAFETLFRVRVAATPQRAVIMPNTPIEQMRLMGIVTNIDRPRAMLTDGTGVGYVVQRGDYLGRADTLQTGGEESVPVALNWRVDRVNPSELVLVRDDPTAPNRAPITRVIPLHDETEGRQGSR